MPIVTKNLQSGLRLSAISKAFSIMGISAIFCFFRSKENVLFDIFLFSAAAIAFLMLSNLLLRNSFKIPRRSTLFVSIYLTLLFFVCSIVYMQITDYRSSHLYYSIVTIGYFLCCAMLSMGILSLKINQQASLWFNIAVLVSSANLVLFTLFLVGLWEPNRQDFAGFTENRNEYSISMVILMVLVRFGYWDEFSHNKKRLLTILFSLLAVSILVSRSITGLILLVYFLYFAIFKKVSVRGVLLSLCLLMLSSAVIYFAELPIVYRLSRFITHLTGNNDVLAVSESAYVRPYMIAQGFRILSENWAFGVGFDNARHFFTWPDRSTGSFLHNNYLDILTSLGIVGGVIFYLPVFFVIFQFLVQRRIAPVAPLLIGLKIIYDFTYTNYFDFVPVFALVFALVVAIGGLNVKKKN